MRFLLVHISNFCNYTCDYCSIHRRRNSIKTKPDIPMKQIIRLSKLKKKDDRLVLSGGEPTLFLDYLLMLRKFDVNFNIATNLSASIKTYKKISPLYISATLHPRFVDNYLEFFDKVRELNSMFSLSLFIMIEPYFDPEFYLWVNENLSSIDRVFSPVTWSYPDFKIPKEIQHLPSWTYKDKTVLYFSEEDNYFGLCSCDVKFRNLKIYENGNFYTCPRSHIPDFNIFDVTDKYLYEYLHKDELVACYNVPCDFCLSHKTNKTPITEEQAKQLKPIKFNSNIHYYKSTLTNLRIKYNFATHTKEIISK